MKRVALVVLVLAGCPPLEAGRGRYQCDPTGNREVGSAQCPGTSRCGLEKFCHEVGDTSVRWKCDSASDCENDWQCGVGVDGVSRECHDPGAPEDFRCVTSADCSGGWTCGLDIARLRRCHDPAKPTTWPCESSMDCVGGWQCGVAATGGRECHDPAKPEAWVCLSNADCLDGWQCGLNDLRTGRECHNPNAPRRFACEVATDCLASWSCGLNSTRNGRECHDPSAPEVFACVVPTDCVAGWQCGLAANRLQRECHDPNTPMAFACERDTDCGRDWRCGPDGLCLDPSADALEPAANLALDAGAIISPRQQLDVDALTVSPRFLNARSEDLATFAFLRGPRLEALTRDDQARLTAYDLGTAPVNVTALFAQGPRSYDYDSNLGQFVKNDWNHVYVATADAGLLSFRLHVDGGVTPRPVRAAGTTISPPPITSFKSGIAQEPTEVPGIVAFSPSTSRYLLLDGPESGFGRDLDGIPSGANRLLDMENIYLSDNTECEFAVDTNGVWSRQRGKYDYFEPITAAAFGNRSCPGGATGLKVERFTALSWDRALVVASPSDGGSPRVAVWDLTQMMMDRGGGYLCNSDGNPCAPATAIPFTVEVGPCVACPAGQLLDLAAVAVAGQPAEVETRCGAPDGGAFSFYRLRRRPGVPGACDSRPLVGPGSLFLQQTLTPPKQPAGGRVVYSAPGGQIWFGASTLSATSLTFDRLPFGLAQVSRANGDVAAIAEGIVGRPAAGIGLDSVPRANLTAVGTNEPSWMMAGDQLVTLEGPTIDDRRTLALTTTLPALPQTLARATASTGATVAVLTAGNQVLSAEVDLSPGGPQAVAIFSQRVALVNPIQSAAFVAPPDGGYLGGYVVTASGVARVTAESSSRWRTDEVALPAELSPREVWFQAGRGRVGFSNGSVFSLPSRVRIVDAIAGGAVEDFVQTCRAQLALTPTGLFRVVSVAGASIGRWEQLPLPTGFAPDGLSNGRVFAVGSDVYVFTRAGAAARLTLESCP